MLVGFFGKAGSGKDYFANYLNKNYNFNIVSLADCLKKCCSNLLGIPINYFYDRDKKEVPLKDWGNKTPREILQYIGTDLLRCQFDPDIFIKSTLVYMKKYSSDRLYRPDAFYNYNQHGSKNSTKNTNWVIPDIRFLNEAKWIKRENGLLIKINRAKVDEQISGTDHISEQGFDIKFDDTLYNVGCYPVEENPATIRLKKILKNLNIFES